MRNQCIVVGESLQSFAFAWRESTDDAVIRDRFGSADIQSMRKFVGCCHLLFLPIDGNNVAFCSARCSSPLIALDRYSER